MVRFYLYLWFLWVLRMLGVTLFMSGFLSLLITTYFFIQKGLPAFESEIISALFEIFIFWFLLLLNLAIPLALFISTKHLFNNCINAISLKLKSCKDGLFIEDVGHGDGVKVWRKLLFLIVWISAVFVLISFMIFYFFNIEGSFFEFLSVYHLYAFILLSGAFALPLLGSRCKSVSLRLC